MPTRSPAPTDPSGRPARPPRLQRADLAPSAGVGAIMGFLAATEGAGAAYGTVIGVVGCVAVLGMLALKRAFYGS